MDGHIDDGHVFDVHVVDGHDVEGHVVDGIQGHFPLHTSTRPFSG